ncbi:hypothetical protein F2Q69_00002958 [Brassica cretica]|uniref:NYN domain-containing protein n=2 Tax=Brassica TaxID=3705 RepID=A0A8S9NSX9_BRACR|nr:hypothetical protein F2Q69_00002958 [Brassica cretica]
MSNIYVTALWDFENSPIPYNKLPNLFENIQKSLQTSNKHYILFKIIAFGPLTKKPGNLPDTITYEELPARTIPCEANPQGTDCLQYVIDQGSSSVRPVRNTDAADLMIIMKAFANFIQDGVRDVLIIAGDGDFGNLLRKAMKRKNVNIMLAYPEKGSAFLKHEARTTFKWSLERSFDAPELMINGGRG